MSCRKSVGFKFTRGTPRYHFAESAAPSGHKRGFCVGWGSRLTCWENAEGTSPVGAISAASLDDPSELVSSQFPHLRFGRAAVGLHESNVPEIRAVFAFDRRRPLFCETSVVMLNGGGACWRRHCPPALSHVTDSNTGSFRT